MATCGAAVLRLSPRQAAVLGRLAKGFTHKEIATDLGVSVTTVSAHCARLYRKLGARRASEALVRAVELGLIRPDLLGWGSRPGVKKTRH